MQTLISIVIPTHNRANLLPRAVESVARQTYPNWELIVVDDASDDATVEWVNAFSKRFEGVQSIRLFTHDVNQGASAARNTGIDQAQGEFVSFLDSDDTMLPHKLGMLQQSLSTNKDVGAVFGGWEWIDAETGATLKTRIPDEVGYVDGKPRWAHNIVPDLVSRQFLLEHKFIATYMVYENYSLLFHIFQELNVSFVGQVLSLFVRHPGSRNSDLYDRDGTVALECLLSEFHSFIANDRNALMWFHLTLGERLRKTDKLKSLSQFWSLLKLNPVNAKNYLRFLRAAF